MKEKTDALSVLCIYKYTVYYIDNSLPLSLFYQEQPIAYIHVICIGQVRRIFLKRSITHIFLRVAFSLSFVFLFLFQESGSFFSVTL